MPVFSLNTWTLEKALGPLRMIEWDEEKKEHMLSLDIQPAKMDLLELIIWLKHQDYQAVEIPYPQFQDCSDEYLERLHVSALESGVELASLLLDYGDVSTNEFVRRTEDRIWLNRWIEIAAKAGFRRVRIPAGESDPNDRDALARASEGLLEAALFAEQAGVRVVTENLGSLLSTSDNCLRLLDSCGEKVGLTADFGNFHSDKYRQLAEILPYAETVHAKVDPIPGGHFDEDDFRRCLELCEDNGFNGPYSLTYLGKGNPFMELVNIRAFAEDVLTKTHTGI